METLRRAVDSEDDSRACEDSIISADEIIFESRAQISVHKGRSESFGPTTSGMCGLCVASSFVRGAARGSRCTD